MRGENLNKKNYFFPTNICDGWFVSTVAILLIFGLLMVASASIAVAKQHFHEPFYYFFRQLICILLGVSLGCIVIQFSTKECAKISGILMAILIFMLALVLLPGFGKVVNGSARWLNVGFFSFQVSEIAKPIIVLYMASFLVRHHAKVTQTFEGFLKPVAILGVLAVLLLKEPDFGSTVVIFLTVLGMMFMAGMRLRYFLLLFCLLVLFSLILAVAAPYRLARLSVFLDPWKTPFTGGYQLTQSLMAFGRGGWFGVGLGHGVEKLFYLPDAYTDFLFAIIAEELGFLGVLFVTLLFGFLVIRIFLIGRRAQLLQRHFSGLVAYGLGFWVLIQFFVSIGVNCGLLPTKGLTLPLISYGGSSMLTNCIAIALLLRIDYESRQQYDSWI